MYTRSIAIVLLFVLFFCSKTPAQEPLQQDSLAQDIDQELILLSKNTQDTIRIKALLEKKPNYRVKDESGKDALETAFFWGNMDVFEVILDHVFAAQDTLYLKNSILLVGAIQTGDTILLDRLLSYYGHMLDYQDRQSYISDFEAFCILYRIVNMYRYGFPNDEDPLSTTINLDLSMAGILERHGFDFNEPDTSGQNILFKVRHNPEVSAYFIQKGVEINRLDPKQKTFLQYYLEEIAVPLRIPGLNLGIDESADNYYDGRINLLKYFIEKGATVGKNGENGWTYLRELLKDDSNMYFSDYLRRNHKDFFK